MKIIFAQNLFLVKIRNSPQHMLEFKALTSKILAQYVGVSTYKRFKLFMGFVIGIMSEIIIKYIKINIMSEITCIICEKRLFYPRYF